MAGSSWPLPSLFDIINLNANGPIIYRLALYKHMSHNKPSALSEEDKMLEEFLGLRPTRAIDRMLNENPVDKVYQLYNGLQEKIRKNTSDLRSTLTDKYQNLVDCSNLLTQIQDFTHQIEAIEKDISTIFHQTAPQDNSRNRKTISLVTQVQQQLYRKQYQKAMDLSHSPHQAQLQESQRLYLPFLRLQILQNIEQDLITKQIDSKMINQTVVCIKIYLTHLTAQEREQLTSSSGLEDSSLFNLIAETLKQHGEGLTIQDGPILQILFKCKLFSLNRPQKGIPEDQKISKFFNDIYRLIGEESRNSAEIKRLSEQFCLNLEQIEAHLAQTFIVTNSSETISFRYDIYEQLLSSKEFTTILEQLHGVVAQHYPEAPSTSLKDNFINLWNNYYHQLLDTLFQRCDFTTSISSQPATLQEQIPPELKKYFFDQELSIEQQLTAYRKKLNIFTATLKELFTQAVNLSQKSIHSESSIEDITKFYCQKLDQLNRNISELCSKLSKDPSEKNLQSIILVLFLCDEFNQKMQAEMSATPILKEILKGRLQCTTDTISSFGKIFTAKSRQSWSIKFDCFFMKYNGLTLNPSKMSILQQIILIILEDLLTHEDPIRSKAFIAGWRQRKQKEQQESTNKKNKLGDLPVSAINRSTFAKKKVASE